MFRRTFELTRVPAQAPARLSADARYVLWVNGVEVGRGPARSQPARQRYDSYDLAAHLRAGTNVVAVLVTYYGKATSFWQPAAEGASTDARLVLEADLDGEQLTSDDSWRTLRCSAYSLPTAAGGPMEGVPVEVCDARRLPEGWREVGFDDASWAPAAIVATSHIGGLAQTRPPAHPFGAQEASSNPT
ncbi:alpha-L-rhamnosidase, partial [Kineococcus sp. T13]